MRYFCKNQFLLFGKTLNINLPYGNKGKIIYSCVKGLPMEVESYCNEYVSSNILEKQCKFLLDKSSSFH